MTRECGQGECGQGGRPPPGVSYPELGVHLVYHRPPRCQISALSCQKRNGAPSKCILATAASQSPATSPTRHAAHERAPSRGGAMIRRKAPRDDELVLPTSSCCGGARKTASAAWPLLLLALAAAALLLRALVFPPATEPSEDMYSSPQAAVVARCIDLKPGCSEWAADHQCRTNPQFMHHFCGASCKVCNDLTAGGPGGVESVVDSLSRAALDLASEPRATEPLGGKAPTVVYASQPRASTAPSRSVEVAEKPAVVTPAAVRPAVSDKPAAPNPRTHPPKAKVVERPPSAAQQQGEGCEDLHTSCGGWTVAGECERNPSFMKLSCRRSCRLCPTAPLSAHAYAAA